MKLIVFIVIAVFSFYGCSENQSNKTKLKTDNYYHVQVEFENDNQQKEKLNELSQELADTMISYDENKLLIGKFDSFRKASDRGFELVADSKISNYSIFYKDSTIQNDYKPFYFVGFDLGRPVLYKSSLFSINPKLVWSRWGREIIKLSRSYDRSNFFIATCLVKGVQGGFPYVREARLYYFNRNNENIKLVQKYGNGLNISSNWESDSTFTTYFTILDLIMTSKLTQKIFDYTLSGEPIDTTDRVYELVNDGIPIPQFSEITQFSPNLRYKVNVSVSDSGKTLNIIDELNGSLNQIAELNGEFEKAVWNETSDYLFVKTSDPAIKDTTELLVINLKNLLLQNRFREEGELNFVIIGNLLIYDLNFGDEAFIKLFRYRKNEYYGEIKIPGGCGVKSLPEIIKLN